MNTFFEKNLHYKKDKKKFLTKKKIVFISIFTLVFIGTIIGTFFLMGVNPKELVTSLSESFKISPIMILYIFLILLFPIFKGIGTMMVVVPKLKDMHIKISWYEYMMLYCKIFVINCVTPFATGSEPYLIYWITTRGGDIKTANIISLINGIGGNIAETLITIPSFIAVSLEYHNLTQTTNGMIVYWFIVGGLCVNVFVLSFFILLAFCKKLHYWISLISNWILKKIKRPHLTKEEIYQKYIVEAEFRKMVVSVFKQWKYITLSALGYAGYSLYFYCTMIFAFMIASGDFGFFNSASRFFIFFNISNVSITASNFIPIPNGEGTIPVALSVMLSNYYGNSSFIAKETIQNSVLLWRVFTTYVPFIGFLLLVSWYYISKLVFLKQRDKKLELKAQSRRRNKISFTFIIPLFNCGDYVCETIDSILNSKYPKKKIQIVVIDDGSTDKSLQVIKKYKKQIEVYKKKNGNWGSVINYAKKMIELTGDYISVIDADDILEPTTLRLVSEAPREDIIIGNFFEWNKNKKKNMKVMFGSSRKLTPDQARTPYCQPLGKFYKKELFNQGPRLKEKISFQDGHLYHGILNHAQSVFYINKPLASWRCDREGNSTSAPWTPIKAQQFNTHFQDVSDAGSGSVALVTMINNDIRKNILSNNLKIKIDEGSINYSWFPIALRPLVKMVISVLQIKKKYVEAK